MRYVVEGWLKVGYFVVVLGVLHPRYCMWVAVLAIAISVLGLVRTGGWPAANRSYVEKILPNEFLGNVLYEVAQLGGRGSLVFQMPIALHFLSGASEFLARAKLGGATVLGVCQKIRNSRNELISAKQKIEICLFFYSALGLLLGTTSFFQALLLFQNVSVKSKFNAAMKQA